MFIQDSRADKTFSSRVYDFCYHLKSRPKCLLNNRYGNDILVWVDNKFYGKIKYNDIK